MDGDLTFRHVTADDHDLVRAVAGLETAVAAADAPWQLPQTPTHLAGQIRHGWDGEPGEWWAGLRDGAAVAVGCVSVTELDNRDLAWLDLAVHPTVRRQGIGSHLLAHLEQRARELGRTKLGTDCWDGTPGRAFAERHGFTLGLASINRRQFLDRVDRALVEKMYAEAADAAAAYELLRLPAPSPEEMLDDLALMAAAINDAPMGDLEVEDDVVTAARVRRYEEAQLARGMRVYRLVARHRDSGELAGHTVVSVEGERPEVGHQHDTSVVRAHRGHRLGLLLKSGMLRWLAEAEPRLATVDTWNAESNGHMIGVNEQLGYEVMGRGLAFQRTL